MRFRPLQHTLASLARIRGRQPSEESRFVLQDPFPATPPARRNSPGLVLLEPPGGHWAVRVLPLLPARGTRLITSPALLRRAVVTNSHGVAHLSSDSVAACEAWPDPARVRRRSWGSYPSQCCSCRQVAACYHAPPRPRAVNVAFIPVYFYREIAAEFSQTSLEVDA